MKKLMLILICMTLLVGTVNASFEFDNIKDYDEETKTVTIENVFGLGRDLAIIKLNTPHINKVPIGYQKIAEMELNSFDESYLNVLSKMELFDIRNGNNKVMTRQIDYKYKTTRNVSFTNSRKVYKGDKTNYTIEEFTDYYEEEYWEDFNFNDVRKGIYTIGLFMQIYEYDEIEWIPTLYGVKIPEWAIVVQSSGTITVDGDSTVHTFTSNGTFNITGGTLNLTVLVVGGGGSGGAGGGGAGGAGGFNLNNSVVLVAGDYNVVVGVGGASQPSGNSPGFQGQNSSFATLVAIGGGSGGGFGSPADNGGAGGSGGGGGGGDVSTATGGIGSQGFNGGDGEVGGSYRGGGGGGAGADGEDGGTPGDGGNGNSSSINGTAITYAGGGGGGSNAGGDQTTGGTGGGGAGGLQGSTSPEAGTANTGGGGGGNFSGGSGAGGSGIVIIRYLTADLFAAPTVTLNEPANNTVFSTNTISMNCTASDEVNLVNVSLILDGVVNETNATAINGSLHNFNKAMSPGDHNWTCRAANNVSRVTTVSIRLFNINISVGTELISPTEGENVTSTSTNFVFNSTPINQDLVAGNITIWFDNGTLVLTNGTGLSGSVEVQSNLTSQLLDENYIWTANTTGTITTNETINRTFTVHTTPVTLNISFPTGNIDFFVLGDSLNLNWSITEPGRNLSIHVVNCSFTYNGVQTFLSIATCVETNSTTFLYVTGVNNLSFDVQDEFFFNTTNTTNWTFSVIENEIFFDNTTIEGVIETYVVNVTLGAGEVISSANLSYNGTGNSVTIADIGNSMFNLTSQLTAPPVDADTNFSFFWQITLASGTEVNTSTNNQTVQNLAIDNCTANTNVIFNYTMLDEETQVQLSNTTFEIDIDIFNADKTVSVLNFSDFINNTNPVAICLNISLTNQTIYALDSVVKYSSVVDYVIEYYNIQNFTLRNSTVPQNINLFELLAVDSTEFQITFKDASFIVVENALIQINRQYVSEGVFKTVEIPRTDSNGQTVAHFVEKDIVYNIIVTKEGSILGTFNNVIAFCDDAVVGQCFIPLNALESNIPVFDYDEEIELSFDFTYNRTSRLLQFIFVTTDGSVKNISMNGTRLDSLGNTSICGDFLVSASGTLSCTVPAAVGNETIVIDIFVDGDLKIQNYIQAGIEFDLGDAGYVLLFFLVLSFALMLSQSKIGVIVGTVLGFVAGILLSFFRGGLVGIGSSIVWLVLWAIALIWKLNSERQT